MECIPNVDVHCNDKDTLSTPMVARRPCMLSVSTSSSYTENLLVNPLGVLPKNSSSKELAQEQANNDTLFCFSNSLIKDTENLCTTNNIISHQSEATMEDTFSHKEDAFNQNEDVFNYKEDVFNNKGDMVHQKEDAFKIEINYFPSSIENSAFSGTPGRDNTTEQSNNIHEITKDETCIIHSINTDRASNGEISDFGVLSEGHSEISKNLSPQTKDCVTEEVAKESEKQPFSIGVDGVKNTYDLVVNFSHGRNVSNQTMCSTDISQLDHSQIAFTGNSTDTQLILIKQEPVEFEENQQMFTTLQSEIETDNINTQMSGHEFGSENLIIKEEIDTFMECEFQNSTDPGLLSSNSEFVIAAQKKGRKRKLVKTDKPKKVERNVKNKIKKSKISAVESNKTKSTTKGNSKIMKIKINKKSKKLKGNSKIEQKTDSPMIKTHQKCTRTRKKKTDFNSDESMNNTHENLNEKARCKTSTEKKCRKPCSKSKNLSTKTKKSGPNKKANSDRKPRTKTKESIPNFMGVQKEQTECVKIVHDIMQDFDSELHLAAKNNNDETVPRSVYHSDEECFGDVIVKAEQDNDPQYYKSQMTFEPGSNITGMKEETGMVMLNSVQESESSKDMEVKTEYNCGLCGKTYENSIALEEHRMASHAQSLLTCDYCGKKFMTMYGLKCHVHIHTGDNPFGFKCEVCSKEFVQKSNYDKHVRIHTGEKPFKCDQCGKTFAQKGNMVHHILRHSNKSLYNCSFCGKKFSKKAYLEKHVIKHSGHKQFQCDVCDLRFSQAFELKVHSRIHKVGKQFECHICNKKIQGSTNLKIHIRTHTGEKPYACEICGKTFSRVHHLQEHGLTHTGHKPYICDLCGKAFHQAQGLNYHIKVHKDQKKYECEFCDMRFIQKSSLLRHIATHSKEKNHICSICEKAFSTEGNLQLHLRAHAGDHPFKCEVCGKGFLRKDHLPVHARVHTGEKPYPCTQCGKAFAQSSQLYIHMRTHTGEKPFSCQSCGKEFSQLIGLKRHFPMCKNKLLTAD